MNKHNKVSLRKYFTHPGWLIIILMASAFAIAIGTAYGLAEQEANSAVVMAIKRLIPAVNWISSRTQYAATAQVTLSIQWIFVIPYWLCLWRMTRPWYAGRAADKYARSNLRSRSLKVIPGFLIAASLVMSDFDLIGSPGFFRGTIWIQEIPSLRLPYSGHFGLALSAFFAPFAEAVLYALIPMAMLKLFLPAMLDTESARISHEVA